MTAMRIGRILMVCAAVCIGGMAPAAHAVQILLSTSEDAELAGLSFEDQDIVLFDTLTGKATLFFDGSVFARDEDIDAVSILANGNIVLSTRSKAKLGGLEFRDGDLAEYNPGTDTATLFLSEDIPTNNIEEISAIDVLGNGNLIISSRYDTSFGGLSFKDGDLVEYNPFTGDVTLFFDEDLFVGSGEDITAADVLSSGNVVLSTGSAAELGGLKFSDQDLVEYNPKTNTASLLFDGNLFASSTADINAVHVLEQALFCNALEQAFFGNAIALQAAVAVPEPGVLALLSLGLAGLGLTRRKN